MTKKLIRLLYDVGFSIFGYRISCLLYDIGFSQKELLNQKGMKSTEDRLDLIRSHP